VSGDRGSMRPPGTEQGEGMLTVGDTAVRWLIQSAADVPAADDWLAPIERARLDQLRVAKRRADWRLGRWTAKRAVAAALAVAPARVAVIASERGVPLVLLDGLPAPLAISLSHAAGRGLCALAPPGTAVGCDLEVVVPRAPHFVHEYFTAAEQERVGADARLVTLVWCAKEAALKALGEGLREDPRGVEVVVGGCHAGGWTDLTIAHAARRFAARSRILDGLVAVIAVEPAAATGAL